MQTYEFYATPKNGLISIPSQYKDIVTTRVKVILLDETSFASAGHDASSHRRTDLLSPISFDTRGWKFDREEANER